MQVIHHWPELHELKLPNSVAKEVWQQLLEPFETEEAAKAFWQEAPSTFIVLESGDSLSHLENSDAWQAIEFAITYPEYTEVLSLGYRLTMAIFTDSGSGVYLVIPPEISSSRFSTLQHK